MSIALDKIHLADKSHKHICMIDYNFAWLESEIDYVKRLWNKGVPLEDIPEKLNRPLIEVWLLLWELLEEKKIKKRRYGNEI